MTMGMHDSGKRQEFETGARRDSADGKSRPDLISPIALMAEGEVLRKGAAPKEAGGKGYGERNWEKGIPLSRFVASCFRHLVGMMVGDTAEDHPSQLRFNAQGFLHTKKMIEHGALPKSLDDMPTYPRSLIEELLRAADTTPTPAKSASASSKETVGGTASGDGTVNAAKTHVAAADADHGLHVGDWLLPEGLTLKDGRPFFLRKLPTKPNDKHVKLLVPDIGDDDNWVNHEMGTISWLPECLTDVLRMVRIPRRDVLAHPGVDRFAVALIEAGYKAGDVISWPAIYGKGTTRRKIKRLTMGGVEMAFALPEAVRARQDAVADMKAEEPAEPKPRFQPGQWLTDDLGSGLWIVDRVDGDVMQLFGSPALRYLHYWAEAPCDTMMANVNGSGWRPLTLEEAANMPGVSRAVVLAIDEGLRLGFKHTSVRGGETVEVTRLTLAGEVTQKAVKAE